MTETAFTPVEIENLRSACQVGAGPLGEAAGINPYVMRKLEARILALVPEGFTMIVRSEPLENLENKQQPMYIYVFKTIKEVEEDGDGRRTAQED